MSTAIVALMAASCTNEELVEQPSIAGGQQFTLSAEHGMASRTILDGNRTLWSEGDQIYVSSADGTVYGVLTLKKGQGTDKAEFFGYISGDPSRLAYTIFPAPKSGNVIDLSNYDASNGQLDAPMIATFNPDNLNSVSFQNETALVKQTIKGANGTQTITLSGDGVGNSLVPKLVKGKWELVKTGSGRDITINGVDSGTNGIDLLIPITTSANDERPGNGNSEEPVTLTVTIQEPSMGSTPGTSVSNTYQIDVQNGNITESDVPVINYTASEICENEEQVKAMLSEDGNITLGNNIYLTSPIVITKNITLDLAGFTIFENTTDDQAFTAAEGSVTKDALIVVRPGGSLTINDSKGSGGIDAGNLMLAIKMTDKNDMGVEGNPLAALTINGGYIKGTDYAVSGNGKVGRENTSVVINGGIIEATAGAAIYQPQNGTMVINDGEVVGKTTAVEIRSGSLTINGGDFVATETEFSKNPSGNGYTITGAAIGVSQHTTNHEIDVIINGGEFRGTYAIYEEDLKGDVTEVSLNISDGNFVGKIYSKACSNFITGGWFNDASGFDYLNDNAEVELTSDIQLTKPILVTKQNVIINLRDNDIIAPTTDVFEVKGGSLFIYGGDEAIVHAGSEPQNTASVCAVWAYDGGRATISGGHYKVGHDKNNLRNDCIYAGSNNPEVTDGYITIKHGIFEYVGTSSNEIPKDGDLFLINCADKSLNSKITVYEGHFKNHVPGYESVTGGTRTDKEVVLGEGCFVVDRETGVEVTTEHSGTTDVWYHVCFENKF